MRGRSAAGPAPLVLVASPLLAALAAACAAPPRDPDPSPTETLAEVAASLAAVEDLDLYRFDPPLDAAGHNVFRAAVARLGRAEILTQDARLLAAMRFSMGVARLRLLDLRGAAEAFEAVAAAASPLADEAKRRAELPRALAPLLEPLARPSLADALLELGRRRQRLEEARPRFADDDRAWLFDVVLERLDVWERELLWRARALSPRGAEVALDAARQVARDHEQSRLAPAHALRLGGMLEELAREEIANADPATGAFDSERASQALLEAAKVYAEVSLIDGRPEREEARGRLLALEALWRRVQEAGG